MGTPRFQIGLFLLLLSLIFFAAPVVLGAPPAAGPVTIEATLTQTSIRVGDQIGLRIAVSHPNQTQIEFPVLYDRLGELEVLGAHQLPTAQHPDGTQVSTIEYIVTGFVPGRYSVPPVSVTYRSSPQGEQETIQTTEDLSLEVVSLLAALPDAELRDIKPPLAIPLAPISYEHNLAQLALGVGVLALAVLAYRRWPRGLRPVLPPVVVLEPEKAARQELDRITRLDLLPRRDYVTFYSLISTCTRRYLDDRLNVEALSSTTRELRRTMESRGLDRWQARVATGLLEECDAAKWAHYEPAGPRAERALTIAFELVDLVSSPQDT